MNWLRNIFCLLIIATIGGLLYLDSEDFRQRAKEWLREEFKHRTGHEILIEHVAVEFPHSVLLSGVSGNIAEYGTFDVKKMTITASLAQLLFGKPTSATVFLEGLKTSFAFAVPLPEELRVDLTWDEDFTEIEGEVDLLRSSYGKFPYTLLGPLKFKFQLPPHDRSTPHEIGATISKIQIENYILEAVQVDVIWDVTRNAGNAFLLVKEATAETFSLANLSLAFSNKDGSLEKWAYDVSTEGVYQDHFTVGMTGSFFFDTSGNPSFELNYCELTYDEHSLVVKEPINVALGENRSLMIPQAYLSVDGRDVSLSGKVTAEALDLRLQLPKQSFALEGNDAGVPALSGDVAATLMLQGPFAHLRGGMKVDFGSIAAKHPAFENKFLFNANFSLDLLEEGVAVQGVVFDQEVKLVEMSGICPIDKPSIYSLKPSFDRPIALHFASQIDVGSYIHHIISPNLWLTGQASLELDVTGPFAHPSLQGNLKFIDGTFERWESGTLLRHINADFDIVHDKVVLQSLQARDALNGRVSAVGELDLVSALNFPFHVDLHLAHSTIVDLDDVELALTGAAIFTGDLRGAFLKGELNADLLDITLKEESAAVKHDIEVAYINQNQQEPLPTQIKKSDVKWPICFDLHVKNKNNVLIHGQDLTSEWKGDIKVTGCDDQPLLNGDLRVLTGEYLFNGKKFKISDGTITFAGELSKKTSLYVVGEMEIDRIIAQVVLKGPLNDPSLLFRSNPPLSQREIIAWILFGRGMGDITPFQGAELAQSINQLKGSGGSSPSVLSRFKDSLGIDRIELKGGEGSASEDLSLQVGKYITPKFFLGVKRSMTSDVNRVGIEANVMKNVQIHAEVGDDTEGQLHLKWKHDY